MRRPLLAAALLLVAGLVPVTSPAAAQGTQTTHLDLSFTLNPQAGTIDVRLSVSDPGSLATLQLALGKLNTLEGEPRLEGDWNQEGSQYVADLEASPHASAAWTAGARIEVQSLEGKGHTSYVGPEFAVVKAGDVMPSLRYTFPQDKAPTFATSFTVDAPDGWSVEGPWTAAGPDSFSLGTAIPRGFLAADDELETGRLGAGDEAYEIVRVAGAAEDETTERILLQARDFLGGIYGPTIHQRYIVVAPDPMFQGGLGSPDGVFLHGDADASVVAHEMVHAYQGWQFSREPGQASVWLAEGTAVVHGKLLEVAAGVATREAAQEHLEEQLRKANEEHAVPLTSAVYGSGNEPAAYTKGAVVVTALNDKLREVTDDEYTFADILKRINAISQEEGNGAFGPDRFTTDDLLDVMANVTRFDFTSWFDRYIRASDVPSLGALFPGQASIRILGTDPSPAVAGQPLTVRVALSNLDTDPLTVRTPVLINGTDAGTLTVTLEPGASAEATAEITPLPRGTYTVRVENSTTEIQVLSPPDPKVEVTVWPPEPRAGANVTVGATVTNAGQAPFRGPLRILVDGESVLEQDAPVASGDTRTFARTLGALSPGDHVIVVEAENGSTLAERAVQVQEPLEQNRSPGGGAVLAVSLLGIAACFVQARRRT